MECEAREAETRNSHGAQAAGWGVARLACLSAPRPHREAFALQRNRTAGAGAARRRFSLRFGEGGERSVALRRPCAASSAARAAMRLRQRRLPPNYHPPSTLFPHPTPSPSWCVPALRVCRCTAQRCNRRRAARKDRRTDTLAAVRRRGPQPELRDGPRRCLAHLPDAVLCSSQERTRRHQGPPVQGALQQQARHGAERREKGMGSGCMRAAPGQQLATARQSTGLLRLQCEAYSSHCSWRS
jgi:hypothetical protein